MIAGLQLLVAEDSGEPTIWIATGPDDPRSYPLLSRLEVVIPRPMPHRTAYELRLAQSELSEQLWDLIVAAVQAEPVTL